MINYYMALRYKIILVSEEEGRGALIPRLPGCVGGGDTICVKFLIFRVGNHFRYAPPARL